MPVEPLTLDPRDPTNAELREILANSPIVAWVGEPWGDFKTLYVSPNVNRIIGHDAESFVGDRKFWKRHIHPDDAESVLRQFSRLPENDNFSCDYRFLHADGRWLDLRDSVRVVRDARGTPVRLLRYWTDVTGQKAAGDALAQSESDLHVITDSLPAFICSIDLQQRHRLVNQAYVDRWSKSREKIVGMTIQELLGDDLYEKVRPHVEAALAGERVTFEYESVQDTVTTVQMRSTLIPDIGADGSVQGFFSLAEDITEQKRVERKIREGQAMLAAFMESSTDSYAILDRDLKYVEINEPAARAVGAKKEEVIGRRLEEFSPLTAASGRLEKYREVLATGRPTRAEVVFQRDGVERRIVLSGFRMGPGHLGLSGHEITERVIAENALKQSEERFHDLVDAVTDRIWETDSDLRITMFSGGPDHIRDSVLGTRPWALKWLNTDTEEWRDLMETFRARRPFRDFHLSNRLNDGRVLRQRASGKPYHDSEGNFAGYRGVVDVETKDVEREAEIRESQAMLSGFMDSATDHFYIFDGELNFVDLNASALARLGPTKDKFIGRNIADVAPDSKVRRDRYLEVLRTGVPYRFEFDAWLRSEARHVHIAGSAFRIGPDRLGMVTHDVTQRVEAARALKESEQRFRDLVETVSDRIWETDADFRITMFTGGPDHLRDAVMGRRPWELGGETKTQKNGAPI